VGPRFEMRLYQIKLGTLEMKDLENEYVLKPYELDIFGIVGYHSSQEMFAVTNSSKTYQSNTSTLIKMETATVTAR